MSCEGYLMPIMASGTGGSPVEATLGELPWATEYGGII